VGVLKQVYFFMNKKIFVSIASYRDPELPKTVGDIISNAEHPELLRIVVYEQNGPDDPSIRDIYLEEQVLVLYDHFSLAKGPNWARAKIQKEYCNEEYYLQIDSHMRCIKNWDTILKHMLELVPEPAVLTQYPPEYEIDQLYCKETSTSCSVMSKTIDGLDPDKIRTGLYVQGFGPKDRFTRIQSDLFSGHQKDRRNFPYTSRAWSACFSFSKGSIVKDAPYDPTFEHLFFGEELDITLKLYTRGYYFFSPHISVFYTYFKRNYRRTYWQDIPASDREPLELRSRIRLHKRIQENEIGLDAFGTIRSIKDYMKFAHIYSFVDCKMNPIAKTFKRYTERPLLK
jgi:[Skp1-protein]-hydroxyproline N-acetylglucosaminyltransferase